MEIGLEISRDINAIDALTKVAFAPMRYGDDSESKIINRLRKDCDLDLSLVFIRDDAFLAHVTFSRVSISKILGHWFVLGLVSVTPFLQKLGIGSALIRKRLKKSKARGAYGCGPIIAKDFYCRSGFRNGRALQHSLVPQKFVQYLSFDDVLPNETIQYVHAFHKAGS